MVHCKHSATTGSQQPFRRMLRNVAAAVAACPASCRNRVSRVFVFAKAHLEGVMGLEEVGAAHYLQNTCFTSAFRLLPSMASGNADAWHPAD